MSDELLNDKGERVFDYDYYLNKVDNLTVSVLKGHLLTEWALNRFARLRFPEPKYLKFKKRGFKMRACMVKASLQHTSADAHWDLVFRLNEIRNEYAHQLEPDVREKFDDLFRMDEGLHPNLQEIDLAPDAQRLNLAM